MKKKDYVAPALKEIPVQLCDCIAGSNGGGVGIDRGAVYTKEVSDGSIQIGGSGRL